MLSRADKMENVCGYNIGVHIVILIHFIFFSNKMAMETVDGNTISYTPVVLFKMLYSIFKPFGSSKKFK